MMAIDRQTAAPPQVTNNPKQSIMIAEVVIIFAPFYQNQVHGHLDGRGALF